MTPAERVKVYEKPCWACHEILYSTANKRCEVCGWLICHRKNCGECGCNYGATPPELLAQEGFGFEL